MLQICTSITMASVLIEHDPDLHVPAGCRHAVKSPPPSPAVENHPGGVPLLHQVRLFLTPAHATMRVLCMAWRPHPTLVDGGAGGWVSA